MSPLLRAYLAFSHISGPLWRLIHKRRMKRGKPPTHSPDVMAEMERLWTETMLTGDQIAARLGCVAAE